MVASSNLLPNGKQQFLDSNGDPLGAGQVYFYIPSTTTFKNTWIDPDKTTLNTNPVVLDAAGEAVIFGDGEYRQVVKDVNGNTIWDQLTLQFITMGGDLSGELPNPTVNPSVVTNILTGATHKNPPLDPDRFVYLDAENANALVYLLWSELLATLIADITPGLSASFAAAGAVGPGYNKLSVLVTSASVVNITANRIVAFTSSGAQSVGTNGLNVSADLTTVGANGLDTGSKAANTWYYGYVIYNPTSNLWGALYSLSATAPTLPSGYTFSTRVSAVRTDASGNLYRTQQLNARVTYVIGVNPTVNLIGASGAQATLTNTDISAFIPPTAQTLIGELVCAGTSGSTNVIGLAPNANYTVGYGSSASPPVLAIDGGTANGLSQNFELDMQTPQHVWYTAQRTDSAFYVLGWIEQL